MTARVSEDWRLASAEVVGGLLEAERQRWIAALHWDAQPAFDLLERTRQSGQAPGLLAYDADGRPHGFTHYFLQNRRLQISGLVAESGEVTRQLLDDVLRTPEAELASEVLCFAFPASTALEGALTRRRFDVTRYSYLQRALAPATAAAPSTAPAAIASHLRQWTEDDAVDTVRLFARSYAGAEAAKAFAPRGTLEEWAQYVAQIIKTPGCGRFLPAASVSVQHPADDRLRGLVLTTTLQRDTAHIAQLAVDPAYRRRGLARALVEEASRRAGAAGCWRVTLLVADDNTAARDLYASLGFEPVAHFLYATRQAPNRLRGQRTREGTALTVVAAGARAIASVAGRETPPIGTRTRGDRHTDHDGRDDRLHGQVLHQPHRRGRGSHDIDRDHHAAHRRQAARPGASHDSSVECGRELRRIRGHGVSQQPVHRVVIVHRTLARQAWRAAAAWHGGGMTSRCSPAHRASPRCRSRLHPANSAGAARTGTPRAARRRTPAQPAGAARPVTDRTDRHPATESPRAPDRSREVLDSGRAP